jgi:2-iminobutanoate/2-iminopropanoate deaminase
MAEVISTPHAPAAIGPYSQAIKSRGMTFISGQIPLDPATGLLVGDGDVTKQAEQVMKNLLAIVAAAGHTSTEIVRCTIFLKDLGHFGSVNAVYEAALAGHRPARATVEVARLPRDVLVEIDAICVGEG